jgi:large subunit ribosomal protein L22
MSKNWQRPNRRDALLGDREGSYAIARHIRMSPQKVRRVVDVVRGMGVRDALNTLRFAPQAASEPVYKVIASAVANAESTENLRVDDLYVSQIFVDEGVTMRRIRPRAKGSASRILKRASHITAVVEPEANRGPIPPSKQVVTMRWDDPRLAGNEAAAKKTAKAEQAQAEKTAKATAKAEVAEATEVVEKTAKTTKEKATETEAPKEAAKKPAAKKAATKKVEEATEAVDKPVKKAAKKATDAVSEEKKEA